MTYRNLLLIVSLCCFMNAMFAQELINKTLLHDGETRAYTIYIPANYQSDLPTPLLFNFHGGSGDIASQIAISDMRPIADTARFIVVYPQALPDPNDGGSTQWTHKEPSTVDDVFFVDAMIDAVASEYTIDEKRVYACGYSNGGEFTFELACRLSNRIAGIGVVARSMFIDTFNECAPTHPMPVLTIHGTADYYEGIEFLGTLYYPSLDAVHEYWSTHNNAVSNPVITAVPNTNTFDGSTVEHHVWNEGDNCVAVEHFKVINGGHDWPGSFGNMDIAANSEIWNFVSNYSLDGLIGCTSTAIADEAKHKTKLLLYPNPVKSYVTIQSDATHQATYELYKSSGELVLSGTTNSDQTVIDLSPLTDSIYFLKVGNQIQKVVKMEGL